LKKNTSDFAQTNQKEIENLLKPFKENLFEFGQKMEHVKTQNTELKTQIDILNKSSETLSQDAKNLTEAKKIANELAQKILSNPIIEEFEVEICEQA